MIIKIGNFLFHYRNGLFPLVYLLLVFKSQPVVGNDRVAAVMGFLVAFTGQLLRALAVGLDYIRRGGKNRQVYAERLVQGGMFAHCRNPLYVGNLIILLGVGIASNSALFLGVALPFFAFAYWAIIAAEENYLRNKYGSEFNDYCAGVNRLMPRFTGLGQTLAQHQFNWRRLITAEYGSAYLWIAALLLVTLKNVWFAGHSQPDDPLVEVLLAGLGVATLGYVVARFLKKSGRLQEERKPAH